MTDTDRERLRGLADGLNAVGWRNKLPLLRLSPAEALFAQSLCEEKEKQEAMESRREQLKIDYGQFTWQVLEKMLKTLKHEDVLEREVAAEVVRELKKSEIEAKRREKEESAAAARVAAGRNTRSAGAGVGSGGQCTPCEAKPAATTKSRERRGGKQTLPKEVSVKSEKSGGGIVAPPVQQPIDPGLMSPQDLRSSVAADVAGKRRISTEWENAASTWSRGEIEAAIARLNPERDSDKVSCGRTTSMVMEGGGLVAVMRW